MFQINVLPIKILHQTECSGYLRSFCEMEGCMPTFFSFTIGKMYNLRANQKEENLSDIHGCWFSV